MIAIYARVSTDRQSTESQLNALREYAGKRLGRPPVSSRLVDEAKKLRSEGMSFRQIGKRLGIPESTVRANAGS